MSKGCDLIIRRLSKIIGKFDFRLKRIVLSGISTFGVKGVNALVQLVSIPLTYNFLGEERFGLLMTILSIIAFVNFADLGLGLGLMNNIPNYENNQDQTSINKAVSSSFYSLVGIAFVFFGIFFTFNKVIRWEDIFNIESPEIAVEANQAIVVFFACFLVSLPFTIIRKIQSGFQEGYYNSLWEGLGNIFSLCVLLIFVKLKLGVPFLILAIFGSKSLFVIINFFYQFLIVRKNLIPRIKFFNFSIAKNLLKEGLLFFVLQICAIMVNGSDSLFISYFQGVEKVAIFAIGYRVLNMFMLPVQALLVPTWPAYNDAIAANDKKWLQKILNKFLILVLLISSGLGLIYFFSVNQLLGLWIGDNTRMSKTLLLAFSIYIMYYNINLFLSSVLNTKQYLTSTAKYYIFMTLIVVLLKLLALNYYGDIAYMLIWTVIGVFVFYFIPGFHILIRDNLLTIRNMRIYLRNKS